MVNTRSEYTNHRFINKKEADPKVKRSASFQIIEGLIQLGDEKE
jgi:hypothetical protein